MYINKADFDNEVRDSIVNTAILLKQCAITCSCGAPAPPIQQKGDKYQCIRCYKKICHINYNLGYRNRDRNSIALPKISSQILDVNYYDDAISLLKVEYIKNKLKYKMLKIFYKLTLWVLGYECKKIFLRLK